MTALATPVDQMLERRQRLFDPWAALSAMTGVDLQWRQRGPVDHWESPAGVTDFSDLSISLRLGLDGATLRCTLTHELMHLQRGPCARRYARRDEDMTERLHSKRLVDPVLFTALVNAFGPKRYDQAQALLDVDGATFYTYAKWRQGATDKTAERVREQRDQPLIWPAPWISEHADRFGWTEAAAFSGARS